MKPLLAISATLVLAASSAAAAPKHSQVGSLIASRIAALGHRNWIVIADSAYPLQTSPGVETVTVDESQLDAVRDALVALARTKNVRPVIHLDAELPYVPESGSPGIGGYRAGLAKILKGRNVDHMLHEQIIKRLDEAGKSFKVLLIKTPHTMPYTSVFLELQCGYWSDASEKQMRLKMKAAGK